MKIILLASICFFCLLKNLNAQISLCKTSEYYAQMIAKDPGLNSDISELVTNSMPQKSGADDSSIFVIPVVFHVLHQFGVENITDAQIYDAMEIINRDYRKLNEDTIEVISEFDSLVADVKIEFKLASYDPQGNCTNGIDRIYTHETYIGDDYSKLNQWDRSRYLNIWLVNNINQGGASYTTYPILVNGSSFWKDGIVIIHNYIGSIGSASVFTERLLTHEVGHWLAIPHLNENATDPLTCGDDGINDTPITKGFSYCPQNKLDAIICNTTDSIIENYQNFMEYSFCQMMFTRGQAEFMRQILHEIDGERNKLITPQTQQSTGINLTSPPVCIPKPAINSSTRFTCVGETVTFTDESFNGPVTFREWTFQDATPATSTDENTMVIFNSYGLKTITLKVGNASGEVSKTFEQYVDVQPSWASYSGPHSFDLEPATQYQQLRYLNDGDTYNKFILSDVGYASNHSMKLQNFKDIGNATPHSEESFYYNRLGGQIDAIITPTFDLRYTSNCTFEFDYSYATNTQQTSLISEQIKVYYSSNCGETWKPLGTSSSSTISGSDLVSAGYAGNIDFEPSSDNEWLHFSKQLLTSDDKSRIRFKIEFKASDYSNNLFIDNINIAGVLGLENDFTNKHNLVIAPNPVIIGNQLNISYVAENEPVTFVLKNLQGQQIMKFVRQEKNQAVNFAVDISDNIAASYYFLEIMTSNSTSIKKIAIIK